MAAQRRPAITAGGTGIQAAMTPQNTGAGSERVQRPESTTRVPADADSGSKECAS